MVVYQHLRHVKFGGKLVAVEAFQGDREGEVKGFRLLFFPDLITRLLDKASAVP